MAVRKIVKIDREKCDGCGECIPNCHEGALQIVDGKATLVEDSYCDGLGDCLGHCPRGAIEIVEREAADYDEESVRRRRTRGTADSAPGGPSEGGCPGVALMDFGADAEEDQGAAVLPSEPHSSALRQWPVQLHLVPANAPYLDGADLLLAADCVPFALANFHGELLAGRRLLVGCPKLDDAEAYVDKLAEILRANDVRSLTVAHMEVPCCHGLVLVARKALEKSGADLPLETVQIGIRGEIGSKEAAEHRS